MNEKVCICYFTGTGNTKLLAEKMNEIFSGRGYESRIYEITGKKAVGTLPAAHESLGVLFPVYALSMPGIVEKFLRNLSEVKGQSAFIMANAHTDSGKTGDEAEAILKKKGYQIEGKSSAYTPSSSIITEETEPEDRAVEMRSEGLKKASDFAEALIEGRAEKESGRMTFKQKMVSLLFKTAMPGMLLKKTSVNDSCVSCGKCTAICPMGNITLSSGKPVWNSNCAVCMRCINYCPSNAIEMMSSAGRRQYKEPVFLSEISAGGRA